MATPKRQNGRQKWAKEEEEMLKEVFQQTKSPAEIHKNYFPHKNFNTVKSKIYELKTSESKIKEKNSSRC